jgi:hypothetical protein
LEGHRGQELLHQVISFLTARASLGSSESKRNTDSFVASSSRVCTVSRRPAILSAKRAGAFCCCASGFVIPRKAFPPHAEPEPFPLSMCKMTSRFTNSLNCVKLVSFHSDAPLLGIIFKTILT